jgi:hypothetical protein
MSAAAGGQVNGWEAALHSVKGWRAPSPLPAADDDVAAPSGTERDEGPPGGKSAEEKAQARKRVGRPLAYNGDPDAPHLTEQERRKIKRWVGRGSSSCVLGRCYSSLMCHAAAHAAAPTQPAGACVTPLCAPLPHPADASPTASPHAA